MLLNFQRGPVPRISNYFTTAITAYVNLPTNSVGLRGWVKGSEKEEENRTEKIGLKISDDDDEFDIQRLSARMNFELHIELFNASVMAYIYM